METSSASGDASAAPTAAAGTAAVSSSSSSSSSSASILSEKVQRALQIQTNTAAMKTALEALGQLSATTSTTTATSGTPASEFALDARSVRHAIEYDALQQALLLRSELSSLCDTLQELRQGISQMAQIAHQVKQAIHAPVMIKSNASSVASASASSSKASGSMLTSGSLHESGAMDNSNSTSDISGGGGGTSSGKSTFEQDEERLAATLAEAFTRRNLAKERLQAVHQFMETFDLSEQDSQLLDHYNFDDLDVSFMEGGTLVNGTAFLNALERVKEIREALSKTFGHSSTSHLSSTSTESITEYGGRTSTSSSLGASSALRMMEHLATKQEQAFERLYHWLQSHLQLFAIQPVSASQQSQSFNTKRVAFENDPTNEDPDSMDQALQHPFIQAALYTLRHVPAFYRHMLELIASRRRQEETRIFLLALTSGYNGMPPLERLAHDPVAYVGDMLAFAFRSLSMEADVAMTIVHFAQQQQKHGEESDQKNDEGDGIADADEKQQEVNHAAADSTFEDYTAEKPLTGAEILSTIMSGMARPLKSRIINVITTLASRGGTDGDGANADSDAESDDGMLDDYFEQKDASVRNKLTHLYDICGLLLFYISAMEKTVSKLEKADDRAGLRKPGPSEDQSSPLSNKTNNNALLVNLNSCLMESVKAFEATVRVYSATLGTLSSSSGESVANLAKALIVRIADVRQSSPGFAEDVTCPNREFESTLSPTWITKQVVEAALPFCSVLDDTVTLKSAIASVQGTASGMDVVAAERLEEQIDATKELLVEKLIKEETTKVLQLCGLGRVISAWEHWKQSSAAGGGSVETEAELMMSHPGLSADSLHIAMQDFDKSLYSTSILPSLETVVKDPTARKLVRTKIAERVCQTYEEMYEDIANSATGGYDDLTFLGHTPVQVRTLFSV
ncbi:hypothetical protein ACA910_002590 [Epithemia clementina (nom. ined.)]